MKSLDLKTLFAWTLGLGIGLGGASSAFAQDSDGDGVLDAIDVAPCDNTIASMTFHPADRTYGMLIFEDSWPQKGDFDFNDFVVAHNQILNRDASGKLSSIRMELEIMAVGGVFSNGLAFRIPVTRDLVAGTSLTIDGVSMAVAPWPDTQEATFTLAPDLHALFGVSKSPVNVQGSSVLPYVHVVFEVRFTASQAGLTSAAPFDLFIFDSTRGVEVHRPEYQGTPRLDAALLGTSDDASTVTRAFVTTGGIPFALELPEIIAYPPEGNPIDRLFPDIVAFGASSGTQNVDFFRNLVTSEMFSAATTPSPLALRTPDVGCFISDPGVCGAATNAGSVDAPTAGLCDFGAPSSVSTSGSLFSWTCTGYYSSPTTCNAPDLVCAPFTQRSCAANNGAGTETCNGSGTGYGSCALSSCNAGYYLSGGACLPQVCSPGSQSSCSIPNGAGSQICNMTGSGYGGCSLVSCDSGYAAVGQSCVATTGCNDGVMNGQELGIDCGGPSCGSCDLQYQILDQRDVTYRGIGYRVLKVSYRSDTSGTENWCREYQELCSSLGAGWRPTGCGTYFQSFSGYGNCITDYDSFVTDDTLGCNASGGVSAAARQAGFADATGQNSFAFHYCHSSANGCSKVMCSGTYCNSALSYFDHTRPVGYTLCRRN